MVLEDVKAVDAIYDLGISHNKFGLPLPDGTYYPEYSRNVSGERAVEFLTNFDRVRDRDWSECSFLDLGCSEGVRVSGRLRSGGVGFEGVLPCLLRVILEVVMLGDGSRGSCGV